MAGRDVAGSGWVDKLRQRTAYTFAPLLLRGIGMQWLAWQLIVASFRNQFLLSKQM